MVIDQLYDAEEGCVVPESPTACVLSWPCEGNLLLFDGRHAHGVLESANMTDVRMTLLLNWWVECPSVCLFLRYLSVMIICTWACCGLAARLALASGKAIASKSGILSATERGKDSRSASCDEISLVVHIDHTF